jgi:hypothetical protein
MPLLPTYWGDPIWKTMYIIAYTFPEDADEEYRIHLCDIYNHFSFVIPCKECCTHYKEFLHQFPVEEAVISRDTLLKWVNDLQNSINTMTKRPLVNLDMKIVEMDKFNNDVKSVKKNIPVNKRIGAVSYGIRRPVGKPPRFNKKGCANCH